MVQGSKMAERVVYPALLLLTVALSFNQVQAGVPGSTGTISGYDTELGKDAVCWLSRSTQLEDLDNHTITPFPNPVVEDFILVGEVELLRECPTGNVLKAYAPKEFGTPPDYLDGIRPRTKTWYNFTVKFTIDQLEISGDTIISDGNTTVVAAQVLVCELGKVGFCSPFIHEEANARLAAQGITTPPDRGDRHGNTHVHSPYIKVEVIPDLRWQEFNVTVPLIINDPGTSCVLVDSSRAIPTAQNDAIQLVVFALDSGNFYAIAALQFYTYDSLQEDSGTPYAEFRYDVANAMDDQTLLTYQDPPKILAVTDPVKITTYVLIGIACVSIAFLLYETIKNRANSIIRVSQGSFLVAFLIAGLWACASSVLLEPKNDVYCNLVTPMIMIPLQLMFSITIGRLWRIQAVVSPLLARKLRKERSFANRFGKALATVSSFGCFNLGKRSLRRAITPLQLARVVALFTLPQVILQIVGFILDPDEAIIQFNDDESVGRMICSSWTEPIKSFRLWSVILLLILFIVLLIFSFASKDLPSLLNETAIICSLSIESIVAFVIGFAIIVITNSPSTSPDVAYLVFCLVVLTLAHNSAWRIMLPKLRMVWRGETVVISKLIDEHRRTNQSSMAESSVLLNNVSGFVPGSSVPPRNFSSSNNSDGYTANHGRPSGFDSDVSQDDQVKANLLKQSTVVTDTELSESFKIVSFAEDVIKRGDDISHDCKLVTAVREDDNELNEEDDSVANRDELIDVLHGSKSLTEELSGICTQSSVDKIQSDEKKGESEMPQTATSRAEENVHGDRMPHHRHHHHHPIVISDDETPTRRLILRMVDLHVVLSRVNQRILSGLVVSHEDWKMLQEASVDLGTVFHDDVKFKWEQGEELI